IVNPESMKILEMLAEGKITVDDANELLAAVGDDAPPIAPAKPPVSRSLPEETSTAVSGLTFEQLADMRLHGVNADFIRELQSIGYGPFRPGELIELRDHGVDRDFIEELRDEGLGYLSAGALVELRDHGVNADFVRDMRSIGF